MPKCDFNKVETTLRHGCSPVNLLHIFRTLFLKNTSGGLFLLLLGTSRKLEDLDVVNYRLAQQCS